MIIKIGTLELIIEDEVDKETRDFLLSIENKYSKMMSSISEKKAMIELKRLARKIGYSGELYLINSVAKYVMFKFSLTDAKKVEKYLKSRGYKFSAREGDKVMNF